MCQIIIFYFELQIRKNHYLKGKDFLKFLNDKMYRNKCICQKKKNIIRSFMLQFIKLLKYIIFIFSI